MYILMLTFISRIDLRSEHTAKIRTKLQETFGSQYDYLILRDAKDYADAAIHEKHGEISAQALKFDHPHYLHNISETSSQSA